MREGVTIVPHTADLQLHVQAPTLVELFRHALLGMFESIEPEIFGSSLDTPVFAPTGLRRAPFDGAQDRLGTSGRGDSCTYTIELDAPDKEQLLVDFLSRALYLSDIHNVTFNKVDIQTLTEHHIKAQVFGEKVTGFTKEIKAVTYHNLAIINKNGLWQTDIVFDI